MLERGDQVIAVCRQPSDELKALPVRIEAGLDQTSRDAPEQLIRRLEGEVLDGVILNAGILESIALEELDPDAIRRQFEVNALAPLLLAKALVDLMPAGSKLSLMSSRMASMDDNTGWFLRLSDVQSSSTVAKSLAFDLKPRGIAVAILHPGLVQTRMIRFNPNGIAPESAVQGLLQRSMRFR